MERCTPTRLDQNCTGHERRTLVSHRAVWSACRLYVQQSTAGQHRRLGLDEAGPVRLQVSYDKGRLVYESRIPLLEIYSRAGLKPDYQKHLGLGLETPQIDPAALVGRRGGKGGGMGGGLGGGRRGGMGGGFGGGRRGGMGGDFGNRQAAPLDLWVKVKLAAPKVRP